MNLKRVYLNRKAYLIIANEFLDKKSFNDKHTALSIISFQNKMKARILVNAYKILVDKVIEDNKNE